MGYVNFWHGSESEYDSITTKKEDYFYVVTSPAEGGGNGARIYKGNVLLGEDPDIVKGLINIVERNLEAATESIDSLNQVLSEEVTRSTAFDAQIQGDITTINTSLSGHGTRLSTAETNITNLTTTTNTLNTNLQGLQNQVSEAEKNIKANTTSVQSAHALIEQAQEDIQTNEENIDKNLSSINQLNEDMQQAEAKIENHQTLLENNTTSINQVNTKADTAQNTANQALNKFDQYLPLGGGTMSGGIQFTSGGPTIQYNSSNNALTIAFL